MIPLRDDQPTGSFPILTILIIAANIIVYIAQQVLPLDAVYSLVPFEITHNVDIIGPHRLGPSPGDIVTLGPSPHPLWLTIFTAMFLHANLLHLGGNMLYLWIFGNNIEDALGKVRFLFFYFCCGFVAAVAQIAADPNGMAPVIGASGAIAGVLGAYIVLYRRARVLSIVPIVFALLLELPAFVVLGFWIVLNVFQGLGGLGDNNGNVAYYEHIGGFFTGVALIHWMGGRRLTVRRSRIPGPPPSGYDPYRP